MPKYHDNQLILLTDAEWQEVAAEVRQSPPMEIVVRLGELRAQHKTEFAAATELWNTHKLTQRVAFEKDQQKQKLQAKHDRLGDALRVSEDRAFKDEMNAKGIEDLREIHGPYTRKVVRIAALNKLKAKPEYVKAEAELGEIQAQIEELIAQIKQLIKDTPGLEELAQAQSAKAGAILQEIRQLERELDAASK